MRIIVLILANIFLLTLSDTIIRDLAYNNYHTEDMNNYENQIIPEESKFFIRFPYDSENEMKFYIILHENTTIFPIYISQFDEYPDDTSISPTNFINQIALNSQEKENTQYIKYSYNINKIKPYLVIYFQNEEALNYISFYAYSFAANTFSNLPMNHSLSIFSLKEHSSYYLLFDTSDGSRLQIETSASLSSSPNYELDIKCFNRQPSEYQMTMIDGTWQKNLTYKLSDDNYKEFRTYEYESHEDYQFCAIHIFNINALNELNIVIKMLEDDKPPIWAIIVGSILGVLVIIGVGYLIKRLCCNIKTNNVNNVNNATNEQNATCLQRFCILLRAICICAYCFASIAEAGKSDYYYD